MSKKIYWRDFNGEYEKIHYDIQLHNGQMFEMCFPNAGTFHTLTGEMIKGDVVRYIKESKYHPMDIED